ncbi:MAG: hypothetical protein EAZ47_09460 [Bacteroidetes bacterium]|nr:MAG: hypothetical protein EAY72_00290 [Bacteroidota bacterium]TAF91851.1 MAG: hypothetical protein EAZ47_09460 [Bacteroidota bacterium]
MKFHYLTFIILIVGFGILSCNISAGSYPYAEVYKINASEAQVKKAIDIFKQQNPEFKIPNVTIGGGKPFELKDEQTSNPSHWFVAYFYFAADNEIAYTYTRPQNSDVTSFAFVSVNKGLNLGTWQDLNFDLSKKETEVELIKFEQQILVPIQHIIDSIARNSVVIPHVLQGMPNHR